MTTSVPLSIIPAGRGPLLCEGLPTKAKEDPSPHEMRLCPAGLQTSISWSRGVIIIIIIIIISNIIIIIISNIITIIIIVVVVIIMISVYFL